MAVHTPVQDISIRTGGRLSSVGPCMEQATLGRVGILQAPTPIHTVPTQLRKCYGFFASTSCRRIDKSKTTGRVDAAGKLVAVTGALADRNDPS
jgi:hypothetical protein